MQRSLHLHVGLAPTILVALFTATGASAQVATADQLSAPVVAPELFAEPLAEDALAAISGRENSPLWQASNAQSNATVKDNHVGDNSPTGALSVTDSAFQNVSGISMVNLNTGNASSINATMNVNLSISMAPAATPGGM